MTTEPFGYDEVPYTSHPFPQTHPERLATIGTLFGMRPPPVETARVLELGCASGGNLIPLAVAFPRWCRCDLCGHVFSEGYFHDQARQILLSKSLPAQTLNERRQSPTPPSLLFMRFTAHLFPSLPSSNEFHEKQRRDLSSPTGCECVPKGKAASPQGKEWESVDASPHSIGPRRRMLTGCEFVPKGKVASPQGKGGKAAMHRRKGLLPTGCDLVGDVGEDRFHVGRVEMLSVGLDVAKRLIGF